MYISEADLIADRYPASTVERDFALRQGHGGPSIYIHPGPFVVVHIAAANDGVCPIIDTNSPCPACEQRLSDRLISVDRQ
jgi:hypothetical protein